MKIMTLFGSSRQKGNSEYLNERALEGILSTNHYLLDYNMNPIIDHRHDEEGFQHVEDDYEELLAAFLEHDIIFFVTPLYWFGMSGQMKIFFDRWSQYMQDIRFDFKEKTKKKKAYVIITGNKPDPKWSALPLIQQFDYIFDYVGMEFVDYIIGQGNKPEEIIYDKLAVQKAEMWNKQLKADIRQQKEEN